MGLEVADWIDELISANPTVADPISQGDDHVRLVKQVLKNAFPGNTAPLTFTGNMQLTGDYNGTNATMTGAVQGGTVTDGTYDLATIGALASRIIAIGQITSATTVAGLGMTSVTQNSNGDYTVTFSTPVASKDDQLIFVSADNTGFGGANLLVGGQYHVTTTSARILNSQVSNGGAVAGFNAFPIDILRLKLT